MMSIEIMIGKGMSLRKALSAAGSSQGTYYYSPSVNKRRSDKGRMRNPSILSKIRKLALQKPIYGTRMMIALLSRELKRPVNRKQMQHAYREMGWIMLRLTKNETLMSASDKIPKPTGINQLWRTDLTYIRCGIDGWAYLFSVIDVYSREWLAYMVDLLALKDNAIQSVVKAFEKYPKVAKNHARRPLQSRV